ncbi:MAG: peptidoglycan recognition family protein [Bacteroidales bacterium]|jgi:N-acetyl-anhydromuramyl-L-alanine amidase AmpD
MAELDLNKIVHIDFPENQYFNESVEKKQIYLHHTVSNDNVNSVVNWWKSNTERVAVAVIIGKDGTIYQLYGSDKWAYHLGLQIQTFQENNIPFQWLDKISIGIEILNWGGLVKHSDNNWYPALWNGRANVPNLKCGKIDEVQEYPNGFRGYYGFEKYTSAQLESVRQLLRFWNKKYNIPLDYNSDMWAISKKALSGKSGIFTHVSVRKDKSDCHPQIELIELLKTLK